MSDDWISSGEGVDIEFKEALPEDRVRWLKTVVAFANGAGGTLYIGVDDDRNVVGVPEDTAYRLCDDIVSSICENCSPRIYVSAGVQRIGGKLVVVIDVFPGNIRPYYITSLGEENGTFIRMGSTSRMADRATLTEFRLSSIQRSFDSLENRDVTLSDENTSGICDAFNRIGRHRISAIDLRNCGAVSMINGREVPTNAYALLCPESPYRNEVMCAVFKDSVGSVFLDRAEYRGPLPVQIDEAYRFVLRNIRLGGRVEGLTRTDVYEIPEAAIRELIVNAFSTDPM